MKNSTINSFLWAVGIAIALVLAVKIYSLLPFYTDFLINNKTYILATIFVAPLLFIGWGVREIGLWK